MSKLELSFEANLVHALTMKTPEAHCEALITSAEVREIATAVEKGGQVRCGVCMGHSPSWDGHLRGCRGWALQQLQELAAKLSIQEDS